MNRVLRSDTGSGLEELHICAESAEDAHASLGAALGPAIRDVVARRFADTDGAELEAQCRTTRAVAAHLHAKSEASGTPAALRAALRTYLASLAAWAHAAELTRVFTTQDSPHAALSAFELALWLQDDNTGCQTGLVRAADGAVIVFHTEEDTIGYFDRPRVVHMDIAGVQRSAFLYPYLLPGPAFGWHRHGAFAYDTLNVTRSSAGGTPTSTLSWLLWWLCGSLPAEETARMLTPYLDGGALALVTRHAEGVSAEQIEVGGPCVQRHVLGSVAAARHVQVNTVTDTASPLGQLELYDDAGRAPYSERLQRASRALGGFGVAIDERDVAVMLGDAEGGTWAFANDDVVAHFVARVSLSGISVHVGAGKARGDGVFSQSWAWR